VEGWDSGRHVSPKIELEEAFGVKFTSAQVAGLKNVGEPVDLIDAKLDRSSSVPSHNRQRATDEEIYAIDGNHGGRKRDVPDRQELGKARATGRNPRVVACALTSERPRRGSARACGANHSQSPPNGRQPDQTDSDPGSGSSDNNPVGTRANRRCLGAWINKKYMKA
jgi:hypothetical protein